jgi:hypothetical protein
MASSSHVSLAALRERPDAVIANSRTLGVDRCSCPRCPLTSAPWRPTAGGARPGAGRDVRAAARGIELGYHNHDWELKPVHGAKTALELIFEAAEGSPLTWQADVAWLVHGGVEPKAWLHRYRGRLTSAHVKDIAPPGQNADEDGWADVGSGVLDWRDLWRACREAGARWLVVERQAEGSGADRARQLRVPQRHASLTRPWNPRSSASSWLQHQRRLSQGRRANRAIRCEVVRRSERRGGEAKAAPRH